MANKNLIFSLSTFAPAREDKEGKKHLNITKFSLDDKGVDILQTNEPVAMQIVKDATATGDSVKIFMLCSSVVRERVVDKKYFDKDDEEYKDYIEEKYLDEPYKDENFTHVEYFKKRISKFCSDNKCKEPEYEIIELKEQDSMNFESVLELSEKIQNPDEEVYIDITGGYRTSAMLLVFIMRLLNYRGIEISKVLYMFYDKDKKEDKLEDVTNLYTNYNLIAAAEEFVKYGSVKTLKEVYNKDDTPEHITELIEIMEEFSEAMKICMVSEFSGLLKNLKGAIDKFYESNKGDKEDKLFAILVARIEEDYKNIIDNTDDIVAIIEWCTERGFIQQALTLYVEKMPKYMVDKKIIYPKKDKEEDIKKQFKRKNNSSYQDWQYDFLTNYLSIKNKEVKEENAPITDDNIDKRVFERLQGNLFKYEEELSKGDEIMQKVTEAMDYLFKNQNVNFKNLKNEDAKLILEKTYEKWCSVPKPSISKFWKEGYDFFYKIIFNSLGYRKTFEIFDEKRYANKTKNAGKEKDAEEIVRNCSEFFDSDIERNELIDILDSYYKIKNFRNSTNHAGNMSSVSKENKEESIIKLSGWLVEQLDSAIKKLNKVYKNKESD